MKLSIMNLFSNHRLVTEVTKTSKYTSRSKLLTSTKEMQISKTGESLNGLSHELPNGTRFFFFFFFFSTLKELHHPYFICLKFAVLLLMNDPYSRVWE